MHYNAAVVTITYEYLKHVFWGTCFKIILTEEGTWKYLVCNFRTSLFSRVAGNTFIHCWWLPRWYFFPVSRCFRAHSLRPVRRVSGFREREALAEPHSHNRRRLWPNSACRFATRVTCCDTAARGGRQGSGMRSAAVRPWRCGSGGRLRACAGWARDPEVLRLCLRLLRGPARGQLPPAARRSRHVPRFQRRVRPAHHHLLARGPPLPSRCVSGPAGAAVKLPRHGPGLPAPPPLPAERGCGRLAKAPPGLAACAERGDAAPLGLGSSGSHPAWSCGVWGKAWWERGAAAAPVVPSWGPGEGILTWDKENLEPGWALPSVPCHREGSPMSPRCSISNAWRPNLQLSRGCLVSLTCFSEWILPSLGALSFGIWKLL